MARVVTPLYRMVDKRVVSVELKVGAVDLESSYAIFRFDDGSTLYADNPTYYVEDGDNG